MSGQFAAIAGQLWRRSEPTGWWPMDDALAAKLWARFTAASEDPTDWFHTEAAALASELAEAIRQAAEQRQQRDAA